MKKRYIRPNTEITTVEVTTALLTGSGGTSRSQTTGGDQEKSIAEEILNADGTQDRSPATDRARADSRRVPKATPGTSGMTDIFVFKMIGYSRFGKRPRLYL